MKFRLLSVVSSVAFLSFLLLLSACGGSKIGDQDIVDIKVDKVRFDQKLDCDEFRKQLPPTYEQGYISVPENWDDPSGRLIQVFYYRDKTKIGTPILFFNGGPAADSHGSFFEEKNGLGTLPFVFMDQRGTGCSDPFPQGETTENIARLSNYSSRSIVKDAEALRKSLLADKPWKILGQSYGGWIVHRYIETAPDKLFAAYSHGAAITSDEKTFAVGRTNSQRRVALEYSSRYPEDETLWQKIQSRIPDHYCFTDGTLRVCGRGVLDVLTVTHLLSKASWPGLHEVIVSLEGLNSSDLIEAIRQIIGQLFFNTDLARNMLPRSVINLVDFGRGGECSQVSQELKRRGDNPETWFFNECRFVPFTESSSGALSSFSKRDPFDLGRIATNIENLNLKFFLYSGQLDPIVPVEIFKDEVEKLGNRVTYRTFDDSGHDGFQTEPQIIKDLTAF